MKQMVYAVLWNGSLIGIYTSISDSANVAKQLQGSTVVSCSINSETDTGRVLLQNVSTAGFTR